MRGRRGLSLASVSLIKERLDKFGDEVLLTPGESDGLLKDELEPSWGSWSSWWRQVNEEDVFDAHTEGLSELG